MILDTKNRVVIWPAYRYLGAVWCGSARGWSNSWTAGVGGTTTFFFGSAGLSAQENSSGSPARRTEALQQHGHLLRLRQSCTKQEIWFPHVRLESLSSIRNGGTLKEAIFKDEGEMIMGPNNFFYASILDFSL